MTIYLDAAGALSFDSKATDGTDVRHHDWEVAMKPNDYIKWRIGGNLQDPHKPIIEAELNVKQASPFASGRLQWTWASGAEPAGCPECLPFNIPPYHYDFGVAVALADGSSKLGEIRIAV
jgi:hypothetical protein